MQLRKSSEAEQVLKNFGPLKWDDATLMTRDGNNWKVLVIPIKGKSEEARVLLAGTQDGETFKTLVFGMDINFSKKDAKENLTWNDANGTMNFYGLDGANLFSGEITNGVIQQVVDEDGTMGIQSTFSSCFGDCVINAGSDPIVLIVCSSALALCAAAPSPVNPGCITLVACVGGAAFFCLISCI